LWLLYYFVFLCLGFAICVCEVSCGCLLGLVLFSGVLLVLFVYGWASVFVVFIIVLAGSGFF